MFVGDTSLEILMGKRGPKPGTSYGPRKKDTPIRRYWRLYQRKYRAKKRRQKRRRSG